MHHTTTQEFSTLLALWNVRDANAEAYTAGEVRVLHMLISYMDAHGQAFPSIRTLEAKCRMRHAAVISALKKLETRSGPLCVKVARADDDKSKPPLRDANGHLIQNKYRLAPGVGWKSYGHAASLTPVVPIIPGNVEPVVPIVRPSGPDREGPVSIRTTEEDLLKKTKEEEERSPSSVPLEREKREANKANVVTLRPWYTSDAISFASDKNMDPVKLADAFAVTCKPGATYTERSFKGYISGQIKDRDKRLASGEMVYCEVTKAYVTPTEKQANARAKQAWLIQRDHELAEIKADLAAVPSNVRTEIIRMINSGTLPKAALHAHSRPVAKTGTDQ